MLLQYVLPMRKDGSGRIVGYFEPLDLSVRYGGGDRRVAHVFHVNQRGIP